MRIKNLLAVMILNIFILLLSSILMEHATLSVRYNKLITTVSTAVDTAVDAVVKPEELMGVDYAVDETSFGVDSNGNPVGGSMHYLVCGGSLGSRWLTCNPLLLPIVQDATYPSGGTNIVTQSDYDNKAKNLKSDDVFKYYFGNVGTAYRAFKQNSKTHLYSAIAECPDSIHDSHDISKLSPTEDFKDFYNTVGNKIMTRQPLKYFLWGDHSGMHYVKDVVIPKLDMTGLNFYSSDFESYINNGLYGRGTNDYLCGSMHVTKSSTTGALYSRYFVTPYTLGVTYIPPQALKYAIPAHLSQIVNYNRIKSVRDEGAYNDTSLVGHIASNVFVDGHNLSHDWINYSERAVINDGDIEYYLDSIQYAIDYIVVDFYDNANSAIVNNLMGVSSDYSSTGDTFTLEEHSNNVNKNPERIKSLDKGDYKEGKRVVACVTVKIKVQIPYKSSVLQWVRYLAGESLEHEHYGIAPWLEYSKTTTSAKDGLTCMYHNYYVVSN